MQKQEFSFFTKKEARHPAITRFTIELTADERGASAPTHANHLRKSASSADNFFLFASIRG
jgi:hypothetical protein